MRLYSILINGLLGAAFGSIFNLYFSAIFAIVGVVATCQQKNRE